MANELRSVFTQAGLGVLSQILAGKGKLSFTRGVASVADWSTKTDEDLQAATKLDDEAQVTTIGNITNLKTPDGTDSSDQVNVALKFMQNQVKTDYAMRVVGLFACVENPDGTKGPEALYTVTVFPQAQWMVTDKFDSSVTVQIATVVGSTVQLNVILADDQGDGGVSAGTLAVFKTQIEGESDQKYALKTALDALMVRIGSGDDPIITQSSLATYLTAHKADFKGDKGDTGATGPKGDPGPTGPQGSAGPQGVQGKQGVQGVPGNGAYTDYVAKGGTGTFDQFMANLKGAKGDKGDTGAAGAKGDPGTPGATGATGPAGPKGATGATGPQGNPGTPGATGPTGATGPAGKDAPADAITAQQFASALGFKKAAFMKQTDYDALATKDPGTAYVTSFDS